MRHHKLLVVLTTLTLVMGLGAPAGLAGSAPEVPIQGYLEGPAVDTPVWDDLDHFERFCDPAKYIVLTETWTTGDVSHLGLTEADFWHCFEPAWDPAGDAFIAGYMDGEATLTAANGDEVLADYTGRVLVYPADWSFEILLDLTVTDGTGRFTDASGSIGIDVVVVEEAGEKSVEMTLEGTISY